MLENKIRDVMLVDELQLDGRLNSAVNAGNRAEFDLLLSMLSPDVTDAPLSLDDNKISSVKQDLRKYFALQKPQEDYAQSQDFVRASELSELLHAGSMQDVFLSSCLKREPLCEYERKLAPEVYASLSPLAQEKFTRLSQDEKIAHIPPALPKDGFEIMDEGQDIKPKVQAEV